jgi:outer membrane protein OmpA-like peptidoglycan-associated protein
VNRLVLLLLLGLAACANPNRIVLLDNEDGHASALTVTNQAGTKVLDRAGEAVAISGNTATPDEVTLSPTEIDKVWGRAIASHPPAPVTFLLYFTLDTITLTKESRDYLPRVLDLIRQRPAPEVIVTGHADRSGDQRYNYELGLRRARLVEKEALAIGVPPDLIHVGSDGAENPLVPTGKPYEPKNRRVEITVR